MVLAVLGVLALVAVHLWRSGAKAMAESDEALAAGDDATAISRARDAAMSVAPWSPFPEQGYARLEAIAASAESHGSFGAAVTAWRAVGTAIRATRTEAREAVRLGKEKAALVRLATRACEGGQTRVPAACGRTTEATLAEDDLPPLSTFTWLAVGGALFLGGGAAAAQTQAASRRLSWLVVSTVGVALATLAVVQR